MGLGLPKEQPHILSLGAKSETALKIKVTRESTITMGL
jgi:hypothetical protein